MGLNKEIVIVAAKRTAIANFNGAFANVPGHELGATLIRNLLSDTNIDPNYISEVILGQVLTAGCGQNPARQAALNAGIAHAVPAWGVNQVCGSGLRAVVLAYQAIMCGHANIILAGGQENMSLAPHVMHLRAGVKMGDASLVDSMVKDGLWDAFNAYHMGVTAENVANEYKITRQMQDQLAYESQMKAARATKEGWYQEEIVPVTVKQRKEEIRVTVDEFIRPNTNIETLAGLKPAFDKDGTVTAGNASGINDGAAIVMVMDLDTAQKNGLTPLARIVSFGVSGVDPAVMGIGPVTATEQALKRAGWSVKDLDVIEANEAFAAQAIAVNQKLGWDKEKVNIGGGAIALGHPIGASGARILVTLLHHLKRTKSKKGLATLCVGGGMGVAMAVERF